MGDDNIQPDNGFTYTQTEADEANSTVLESVAQQFDQLGESISISKLGSNLFPVREGTARALRAAKSLPSMAAEISYLRVSLSAARAELAVAQGAAAEALPAGTVASRADAEAEVALEDAGAHFGVNEQAMRT